MSGVLVGTELTGLFFGRRDLVSFPMKYEPMVWLGRWVNLLFSVVLCVTSI